MQTNAPDVRIPLTRGVTLNASLTVPVGARGCVAFAHGGGSSRHSPRNRLVASVLQGASLATLLLDLLTPEEDAVDRRTAHLRFDIDLLAARLVGATRWLRGEAQLGALRLGYFGASTGAAAALLASAELADEIGAVVSRGGRPDLAVSRLSGVRAPTLLIVGGDDPTVLALNREALEKICVERELVVIPHATHLFEEPGALQAVAQQARAWFSRHLAASGAAAPAPGPP